MDNPIFSHIGTLHHHELLSNGLQPTIHHGFQAAFHQTNILAALLLQVLIMQARELNAHLVTGVQKYWVRQIFSLGCSFW